MTDPTTAHTAGPRWLQYVPVDDLPEDERNPKAHADDDLDASLTRFQFTEPCLLDERTGKLVAGHGRKAAVIRRRDAIVAGAELAVPEGIVVTTEGVWTVPIVRGWASANDDEAAAYLVTSNRLTEKGGWVAEPLANILAGLRELPDGLLGVGYQAVDVDAMLADLAPPNFDPVGADEQPRLDVRNPITCPQCGHTFHRV